MTSHSSKQILNIKDSYTPFPKYCGHDSIIHHAYQESFISLFPYQEVPSDLHLYKQRFYCTQCHHTFSVKTYHVAEIFTFRKT